MDGKNFRQVLCRQGMKLFVRHFVPNYNTGKGISFLGFYLLRTIFKNKKLAQKKIVRVIVRVRVRVTKGVNY